MRKRTKIYGIKNMTDGKIYYVGRTNRTVAQRFREHMEDDAKTRKTRWIQQAKRRGHKLRPVLLENVPTRRAESAEQKWIDKGLRKGWPLKNTKGVNRPQRRGWPASSFPWWVWWVVGWFLLSAWINAP